MVHSIADTDFVVTLDSDGEDNPRDISLLLDPLIANPENLSRVAVAQRTQRLETFSFKVSYIFFKYFFRLLTGTVIRSGNFAAYRGCLLKKVIFHLFFDFCYSSPFVGLPLNVQNVPIPRGKRYSGRSKMSFLSLVNHGFRMLLPFSEKIAVRAIIFSGVMSACCITALLFLSLSHASASAILIAGVLLILCILIAGISSPLFAIFNQSRATGLRTFYPSAQESIRIGNADREKTVKIFPRSRSN